MILLFDILEALLFEIRCMSKSSLFPSLLTCYAFIVVSY